MLRFIGTVLLGILSATAFLGADPIKVVPRDTDPAIGYSYNSPHFAYTNGALDRHQLLLFLPGTHGQARGAKAFCQLASDLGYHVVNLMYPDDIPASVCAGDREPGAFEDFRLAVIQGGKSRRIKIDAADSIENRTLKLLLYLQSHRPTEGWGQFLNSDGTIKWTAIAVAGHSQGGGHAALIAIKHRVARVICLGAPKDYSERLRAPAAWYHDASATPKAAYFAFNHLQDTVVSTPTQMLQNLAALGLDAFGGPVDAAVESPPYHHARILTTSYPAVSVTTRNSPAAKTAHVSVIASANGARWNDVWTYLLTENVP